MSLDGKPTERNLYPQLKIGYENKATPGRHKLSRTHLERNKTRIDIADQLEGDTSIQSESGCASSEIFEDDISPEAICDFNVVFSTTTCTATQYEESDFIINNEHTYAMPWQDVQEISTKTNIIPTEEKGVHWKTDAGALSANKNLITDSDTLLYTGVSNHVFFFITLVDVMSQFNTFTYQLNVADQLMLVLMRLKLN